MYWLLVLKKDRLLLAEVGHWSLLGLRKPGTMGSEGAGTIFPPFVPVLLILSRCILTPSI